MIEPTEYTNAVAGLCARKKSGWFPTVITLLRAREMGEN